MNGRTLTRLSVLVAVLAAIVVIDRPRAPADPGTRARLVADFDATKVDELRLRAPGRPEIVLARAAGGSHGLADFALRAPIAAPADLAAVRDLFGTLEYVSWRRRVPAGGAREAAARGLDAAVARTVTVGLADGTSVELQVGRAEPTLERTWMARAGSGEHVLVDDYFARALDRSFDDLRRRDPLPLAPDRLDAERGRGLVIEAGAARLALHGDPPCVELEAGGACARADAERVGRLVRRLADLRVARFLGDAEAPRATDADAAPALLIRAAGRELRVHGACPGAPELRVTRSELGVGCVRGDLLDALTAELADPFTWVDRTVLPYGLRELREITLARGDTRVTLVRDGGAWLRVEHDGSAAAPGAARAPVDDDALAAWWRDLASFEATEVVRVTALPGPPANALTLRLTPDAGAPLVMWLSPAAGTRVLVHRAGEPVALVAHADVARYFEPDPVQFASRELLEFEASALRALEIVRHAGGGTAGSGDSGGTVTEQATRGASLDDWSLTTPLALAVDLDALAALRDTAAHLHAKRAASARALPAHGLAPPRLSFSLVLDAPPTRPDDPPPRLRLELGALTSEGECYARVPDAPAVYLLDAASCAALAAPLATRAVFGLAAEPAAIELGSERYERHGPGWYGPDGLRLPDRVADTLAAIVPALGAPAAVLGYGTPAQPTPLTITWADGTTTKLRMGRNEYALEGRAVRYALPTEVCGAFARLCK